MRTISTSIKPQNISMKPASASMMASRKTARACLIGISNVLRHLGAMKSMFSADGLNAVCRNLIACNPDTTGYWSFIESYDIPFRGHLERLRTYS